MSEFFSSIGRRALDVIDPSRVEERTFERNRRQTREQLEQSRAERRAELEQIERELQMLPERAREVQSIALKGQQAQLPLVFANRANQTAEATQFLGAVTDAKTRLAGANISNQLRDRGGTARQALGDVVEAEAATRDAFLGDWTDRLIAASERRNQLQDGLIRDSWQAGAPKTVIGRFAQELLPIGQIGLLVAEALS